MSALPRKMSLITAECRMNNRLPLWRLLLIWLLGCTGSTSNVNQIEAKECQRDSDCVSPWTPQDSLCAAPLRCVANQCLQPAALTGVSDPTTGKIRFDNNTGTHQIDVEIADDPFERARGLMCRQSMARNWWMVFLMPRVDLQRFWMKNTLIPLDIIFLDEYWNVVGIVANATPLSMTSRGVGTPSKYVLELNAGESERYGMFVGQAVQFIAP